VRRIVRKLMREPRDAPGGEDRVAAIRHSSQMGRMRPDSDGEEEDGYGGIDERVPSRGRGGGVLHLSRSMPRRAGGWKRFVAIPDIAHAVQFCGDTHAKRVQRR
jgi:hypothetical protein